MQVIWDGINTHVSFIDNIKYIFLYYIMDWSLSIIIGTLFFVSGQACLRKSFEKTDTYVITTLFFTLAIGLCSLIAYFVLNKDIKFEGYQPYYASTAGILFFIGFFFWIYSISSKAELGNIRVFMAGFEMLVLYAVGYLVFNEQINMTQGVGALLTMLGIYIVGTN
uniref:EamA domain-containing protein n=1 Tax=viral metagenome TaxID=1070528 RepID=A0A6C0C1S4_9ZZZZ